MFFIALPLTTQPPWNMTACFSDVCFFNVVYSFVLVSWMQWLDSSFPCRRSIDDKLTTCALLKIQLHSSSRLVNFPPRPCEQHIICSRYIGWVVWVVNNEICFQKLAPVDLQKTVTEFPSHCYQDSSLFPLWQVKAWWYKFSNINTNVKKS